MVDFSCYIAIIYRANIQYRPLLVHAYLSRKIVSTLVQVLFSKTAYLTYDSYTVIMFVELRGIGATVMHGNDYLIYRDVT